MADNDPLTVAELKAAADIIAAVAEAIKELRAVPSGHLYARLCGHMSLQTYQGIIGILVRQRLVSERDHLLTWIGAE